MPECIPSNRTNLMRHQERRTLFALCRLTNKVFGIGCTQLAESGPGTYLGTYLYPDTGWSYAHRHHSYFRPIQPYQTLLPTSQDDLPCPPIPQRLLHQHPPMIRPARRDLRYHPLVRPGRGIVEQNGMVHRGLHHEPLPALAHGPRTRERRVAQHPLVGEEAQGSQVRRRAVVLDGVR